MKGILLFAENNTAIDYAKLALISAHCSKYYLNLPITLVTNPYTAGYIQSSFGNKHKIFDKIIELDYDQQVGDRIYRDTVGWNTHAPYYNKKRVNAFEISPYKKTLMFDVDYLVQSTELLKTMDINPSICINSKIKSFSNYHDNNPEMISNPVGIDLYWATLMYWEKNKTSENYFEIVKNVVENYSFYTQIYKFTGNLFRNDYVHSIASHIFNDFQKNNVVNSFTQDYILTSYDTDDLVEIPDISTTKFLVYKGQDYDFLYHKSKNLDIHVMNKPSLLRNFDRFMELYCV